MKVYLDSSTLVAGLVTLHEHHVAARPWLEAARARSIEAIAALHASAETWRTLLANPMEKYLVQRGGGRITNDEARVLVLDLFDYIRFLPSNAEQYRQAIERCSGRGYRSSVIYDALHLSAAENCGADAVVTLNAGDFERLTEPSSPRIVDPMVEQPPGQA